jgi:tetratricopeptide (TPR) repeat protein
MRYRLVILTALLCTVPVAAQPSLTGAARWADSARRLIHAASLGNDAPGLRAGGEVARRALSAWPAEPTLLHYSAFARYREVMTKRGATEAETDSVLKIAADELERSAATLAWPETQALLASCYGTLAGRGMMAGMRWGNRASDARERALAAGPNNPRVLLLTAISAFYTPAMWGGGRDKAMTHLRAAIAAFEQDRPAAPAPAWGRSEAYAWLGQFERAAGRVAEARAAYERALAIDPEFTWVRQVLLPQVNAR